MATWVIQALLGGCCFGLMSFFATYALKKGLPTTLLLFFFGLTWVFYSGWQIATNSNTNMPNIKEFAWLPLISLLIASLLSVFGNIWQFEAFNNSPNPGLVSALIALQMVITAVLAWLFLDQPIGLKEIIGIIFIVSGIIFISYK